MLKTILNRPVAVVTVFIVVVAISLLMVAEIPLDMYPDMDVPILSVTVPYPGAGPEEVEEEVTRLIEGEMSGMEGLDSMESTSTEGLASVVLTFDYGSDITSLEAEARSRIDRIRRELPADAEQPILQKFDPATMPVMSLSVSGDRSERDLDRIVTEQVIPALESLEGVAGASLEGIRDSIVQVDIDLAVLEAYNLSLTSVARILASQNYQLGAGTFEELNRDILVRTSGRFESLEEVSNTVILTIPVPAGGTAASIRLRDVGTVSWGYADPDTIVRINGESGYSIQVRKGSDENSVNVVDAVKARIPAINAALPDGVEVAQLTDSTSNVRNNLINVSSAALLGVVLTVIILLVFLRQWKITLIAGLSIPIALAITTAGLAMSGRTLNIVTLVGLAMGVGLIVDSSVVIIENIYRYRMKGAPMSVSAERGAGEMMAPIIASTLTTIAVFLPLLLYKNDLGFIGTFFGELSFVIILALLASLLVAAVLVPVLSSRFLTIHTREEKPIRNRALRRVDQALEKAFTGMEGAFGRLLAAGLRHKFLVILIAAASLVASFLLIPRLEVSMMPSPPQTAVYLAVDFPTGTALGETESVMSGLYTRVADKIPGVDRIVMSAGKADGSLEFTFRDDVSASAAASEAEEFLRDYLDDYPGVRFTFESTEAGSRMLSSSGVDVAVTGTNWEAVMAAADEIETVLKNVEGITEVSNGAERGLPQAEIVFDRQALYEQGLSAQAVAAEVRALTAGTSATEYLENGDSYDVVVRLAEYDRNTVTDLERMFVMNSQGERVSVSQIAEVRRSSGPTTITREDQVRTIHVSGSLADGSSVRGVTRATEGALAASITPRAGVEWVLGGEMEDFAENAQPMMMVLVIALFLVVAVMVAQFESFKDPLVIVMALPMMLIGVIVTFVLTGTTISMISLMGVVMLLGIVVNNGIILVDHMRLMRRRGMGVREASVESGRSRLRPVLITSLTTILAMVPLAFFPGEGGEMMQPLGVAVVGGLTTSMIGTLLLVPTLYAVVHRKELDDYQTRRQRRRSTADLNNGRRESPENLKVEAIA